MKKLILTLTAAVGLTIGAHAVIPIGPPNGPPLEPKSDGSWSYEAYRDDLLFIRYKWSVVQGDWWYEGSIDRYYKSYSAISLPYYRIQNTLWIGPGFGANGKYIHKNTILGPVPGRYFYRKSQH